MKQQTTSLQQQWLQAQQAMASRQPLRPRQPLCIDDQQIGSIEEDFARKLGSDLLVAHGIALRLLAGQWRLEGQGGATDNLNRLAQAMRSAGLAGAWRNEQLAVCNAEGRQLATVERGAVRPLGIATRAVHLVGACADGSIWVQQRSEDKANNPGMWDTLMGGMVSAADGLAEALARETWEEAGLHVAELGELRHGGNVMFARPSDEAEGQGYMVERIDWFSALVPDALQPVNQDGEVQRFERLELTEVQGWMLQGRFTPEASLVLAAYMGW
ncbi:MULTISPECIES: NUDIX hydrolase [Comamonas]|uniref:NUDIX hydrolase n=1 Tax=Comamonas TaxID=283 RepID=UPI0006217594|nr:MULTISPECIES: DUF4743 domain-containing protein [Comamonas]KKI11949.1 NUDIX hydrolase [Comamonas thiooxydans]TYK75953.1 DUF4743 domain-containing protein [Comamonas sp. Z1]BCX54564.1 hypothetical protein CTYAZ2_41430 [Comamonas testosteroni]